MGNITTKIVTNGGGGGGGDSQGNVSLSHFHVLQTIGQGSFGQVQIVKHRQSKRLYALKAMNKVRLVKTKMAFNVIAERNILARVRHVFISRLCFAMQDKHHVYLVLNLMTGGDLGYQLKTGKQFTEQEVAIWVAEIACALHYLHKIHRVVHRDVKPENILLDTDGHAVLNDFSIATQLPEDGSLIIGLYGTKPYNPPEVFDMGGFGVDADWWALGIVLYECLYKRRPFNGKSSRQLRHQIQTAQLTYPPSASQECRDAIGQLLERRRGKSRLGSIDDNLDKGMFAHPFFTPFTVESLESKCVHKPLFNPCLSRPVNYDESLEIQKILVDDNNKNNCLWQNSYRLTVRGNDHQSLSSSSQIGNQLSLSYLVDNFLPFISPELVSQPAPTAIQLYSKHNKTSVPDKEHPSFVQKA